MKLIFYPLELESPLENSLGITKKQFWEGYGIRIPRDEDYGSKRL